MASVRKLKKDIDYLVFEVVSDCLIYSNIHNEDNSQKISEIIEDAIDLRNDLIARVNQPDGKGNPKIVKLHYKTIRKDLSTGVDKMFDSLSSLSKK
jgi:hypothetical protein